MRFVCESCKTKYSIDDARVRGKVLKIRCKTCGNIITVREEAAAPVAAPVARARGATPSLARALNQSFNSPAAPDFGESSDRTMISSSPMMPAVAAHVAAPRVEPDWFVSFDGEQEGPYLVEKAAQRVRDEVARGKEAFAWRESFDEWLPVNQVPELARLLAAAERAVHRSPIATAPPPGLAAGGTGVHSHSRVATPVVPVDVSPTVMDMPSPALAAVASSRSASTTRAATPSPSVPAVAGASALAVAPETVARPQEIISARSSPKAMEVIRPLEAKAPAAKIVEAHKPHDLAVKPAESRVVEPHRPGDPKHVETTKPIEVKSAEAKLVEQAQPAESKSHAATVEPKAAAEAATLIEARLPEAPRSLPGKPVEGRKVQGGAAIEAKHADSKKIENAKPVEARAADPSKPTETRSAHPPAVPAEGESREAPRPTTRPAIPVETVPAAARASHSPVIVEVVSPRAADAGTRASQAAIPRDSLELPISEGSVLARLPDLGYSAPQVVIVAPGAAPSTASWLKWFAVFAGVSTILLLGAVGYLLFGKKTFASTTNPAAVDTTLGHSVESRPVAVAGNAGTGPAAGTTVPPTLPEKHVATSPSSAGTKLHTSKNPGSNKPGGLTAEQAEIMRTMGGEPVTPERAPTPVRPVEVPHAQIDQGAAIRDALQKNKGAAQRCYEIALKRDSTLQKVRIDMDVKVGISGAVTGVGIATPEFANSVLGDCLKLSIRKWHFQSSGEEYNAQFPFLFQATN